MAVPWRLSSSSEQTAGRSQSYSEKLVWSSTVFSPKRTTLVSYINQYQILKSVKIFLSSSLLIVFYYWHVNVHCVFNFRIGNSSWRYHSRGGKTPYWSSLLPFPSQPPRLVMEPRSQRKGWRRNIYCFLLNIVWIKIIDVLLIKIPERIIGKSKLT
jgi:hypothetical protein